MINANTSKSNQTINFSLSSTTYVWGSPDETLNATTSSGLPVTYESTNTDVAVIVDGKLQVKHAGTTTINAIQSGNSTYNPAPIIGYELTVPIRNQEITFNNIPEVTSGDPAFLLQATSNNPEAKFRFSCSNNQVAVVWNNQVRQILGAGTATISVSDNGNDYFTSAQTSQTLTVKPKTHSIPTNIEAEYYTSKKGVNIIRWSNSVFYLNSWNVDDFAEYTIDVPEEGTYEIEVFAASPGSSKKLKVMNGSIKLASISLTQTPSLTVFRDSKANITLPKGVHKIKIVGEVGGFNLDRIKITQSQEGSDGEEHGVYRIINVETGKFLGTGSSNSQPVVMRDTDEGIDRKWEFVSTKVEGVDYYNIDSKDNGILRATGSGFGAGAYLVVSTTKESPAADTDKIWTLHRNDDGTFRFEAKNNGRFLYHNSDGNCYNVTADEDDTRSKWRIEGKGGPVLSLFNQNVVRSLVKVYPNPTKNKFTIKFDDIQGVKNIKVYNPLGKQVYKNKTHNDFVEVQIDNNLKFGVYLIKVLSDTNKVFYSKLIIK